MDTRDGPVWLTEASLAALYGTPAAAAVVKVRDRLTEDDRRWVEAARFCVLSTVGPEGTDASPRGDDGPVVAVLDDRHLALPDWRGNERIDSLRNIVRDPRVSLMFLIRGSGTVIRVNGTGRVTADAALTARFARPGGEVPRCVVVVELAEVYFQCARAVLRAGLWAGADDAAGLPGPGAMLARLTEGTVGGADYDAAWPARAAQTLW